MYKFIEHDRYLMYRPAPWMEVYGFEVGDIFTDNKNYAVTNQKGEVVNPVFFIKFPHIFKKLKWFEGVTLDDLCTIKYVRITQYTGYWGVGDVVPVTDYDINAKARIVVRFQLEYTNYSIPDKCIPATEKEYNEWKKNGRKPI